MDGNLFIEVFCVPPEFSCDCCVGEDPDTLEWLLEECPFPIYEIPANITVESDLDMEDGDTRRVA